MCVYRMLIIAINCVFIMNMNPLFLKFFRKQILKLIEMLKVFAINLKFYCLCLIMLMTTYQILINVTNYHILHKIFCRVTLSPSIYYRRYHFQLATAIKEDNMKHLKSTTSNFIIAKYI